MFDDTLRSSGDELSRRGLSALTSFGLQALVVAALLVFPLLRPMGLPALRALSTPVSLGRPLGEAPVVGTHGRAGAILPANPPIMLLPSPRFTSGPQTAGDDGPPQVGPVGGGTAGVYGAGDPTGVPGSWGGGARPIMPAAPVPAAAPIHISHMSEGDLVHKILPAYPPLARSARIQGQVVLQAVISKQGTIENLRVLSGHPMLVPAAIDAVRQWRYRPYFLNSEAVEVETQITVNFSLGGN
jgi:periplasmic protein TonB